MKNKLWTRDFTIITLGTVVSMLGNAISGFAIGLLVLDFTQSILLYALYMVAYSLPKIFMPFLSGPLLDRFSRRKVIYTLDFVSAALYFGFFISLSFNYFNYWVFIALCVLIGSIDSVYQVAYESFYPTLISEGNFQKAYSISSMIYTFSALMVAAAAYIYETAGTLAPLFAFNAVTFLIAAIAETQIRADESQVAKVGEQYNMRRYMSDFKEGIRYITAEKGLLFITIYFFINAISMNVSGTLVLPWFKSAVGPGVLAYTYVMGCGVVGRLIGGFIHYRIKLPVKTKYTIALFVYIVFTIIDGVFFYFDMPVMMTLCFISGMLGVTSYNIRISATQNYVPNDFRGRFNGAFMMLCSFGGIIGQLSAGSLGDYFDPRYVVSAFMAFNFIAIFAVIVAGRKEVANIYNREV